MATSYRIAKVRYKGQRTLYWAPEQTPAIITNSGTPVSETAGTGAAGTLPSSGAIQEPVNSVDWTLNRKVYTDTQLRNFAAADSFGQYDLTGYTDLTLGLNYHPGGLLERLMATIGGDITETGASETVSGTADPYTHLILPGPNGNRTNTFSFWVVDADTNLLTLSYGTVASIALSGTPDQPVDGKVSLMCWRPRPTTTQPTTPDTSLMTATFIPAFNGTFAMQTSANDGTTLYGQPYNWDLTISRKVNPYESNAQGQTANPDDVYDFISGPLNLEATMDTFFDGYGSHSATVDFLNLAKLGSSNHPHSIGFADTTGSAHGFTVKFWPAYWSGQPKIQVVGDDLRISGKLTSSQDAATANAVTTVESIQLVSPLGTGLLA